MPIVAEFKFYLVFSGAHTDGKSWQSYFFRLLRSCDQISDTPLSPNSGPFLTPIFHSFNSCSSCHTSEHTNAVVISLTAVVTTLSFSYSHTLSTVQRLGGSTPQSQHCTFWKRNIRPVLLINQYFCLK